jgi:hypothetical protein
MSKTPMFVDFSNVAEVFDKMTELGFFVNESHRDEAISELPDHFEHWYSNGVVEVKVFRGLFGAYELRNYRGIIHPSITDLFSVARLSKNGSL